MVDQLEIERRARALIQDGLGVLQAWNQACREAGALDYQDRPDPLDEADVVRIIRVMDVQGTVLLMEDLRQAG
jgi:hypothetical protein